MNKTLTGTSLSALPNSTLIAVTIVFVLLHLGLLACMVFSKKRLHPMYYLLLVLATILYASPFDTVTMSSTGRWLRVYVIALTAGVGLLFYCPKKIGLPAKTALIFGLFAVFNAAMTGNSGFIVALTYKGIFLLSIIAGITIAYSVRKPEKIFKQLRWFVALMAIYAFFFVYYIATNPSYAAGSNRMYYGKLPVMLLAVSVASVAVFCMFIAMYDSSIKWKIIAAFASISMGLVVLLTGSRGPTGAMIFSCCCMALPLVKRPTHLIVFLLLIALGVTIVASSGLEIPQLERALGLNTSERYDSMEGVLNQRLIKWQYALSSLRQNPLFGCGFTETGLIDAGTSHSSYVQLITESGIVGTFLFLIFCVATTYSLLQVFLKGKNHPNIGVLRCLPVGCIVFAGMIGISESTLVYGTNFSTIVLMLGIGYTDWMYQAIKQPQTEKRSILVRKKVFPQTPPHSLPEA